MEDDEQQPTETPRKAYLGRYEALNAAIEQKSDTLAPEWNTEDLTAVFARLRSLPLTDENIDALAKEFEETSPEDIRKLIDTLKELILETEASRFQHNNFVPKPDGSTKLKLSDDEIEAAKQLSDIVSNLSVKKKMRCATSERLKDVLKMFANEDRQTKKFPASSDVFCPGVEYEDEVNYSNIYKFLSEAAIIKKPKPLRPLESAIVLNVFNEIQALADDYFDEHVDFFREFLCDLDTMKYRDLTPLQMDEDKIGKDTWNLFNLPDDLVDLSAYVAKQSNNEPTSEDPMDDEPSTSNNT